MCPLCDNAKGLLIINLKEARTNSTHTNELSLLSSYKKIALLMIGKNKDALGSRPVRVVTFRLTYFHNGAWWCLS